MKITVLIILVKKKYNLAFLGCLFFEKLYAKNLSQILYLYCSRPRLQVYGYLTEAAAKQFVALFDWTIVIMNLCF